MRNLTALALVLWLCGRAPAAKIAPEACALVVDVKGSVQCKLSAEAAWQPAALMTLLGSGCQLKVGAGAEVSVSYTKTAQRGLVGGPCLVEVSETGLKVLEGDVAAVKSSKPAARTSATLGSYVNIQRMGGGRSRAEPEEFYISSDPASPDLQPTIRWEATGKPFSGFELTLEEEAGKTVTNVSLPATARSFQLPPLSRGCHYTAILTGMDGPLRVRAAPGDLEVLEAETVSALEVARQAAEIEAGNDPQHISEQVGLLTLYWQSHLYTPALPLAERLIQARPQDANLCLILARLYDLRFQPEKAKEMNARATAN